MAKWSTKDMPSQAGRVAVITGATGGLGYETALALAVAGADVVLTGRNPDKGAQALSRIHAAQPDARISFERVDLASLADVRDFARRIAARHPQIHILVNNAGVMAPPRRELTADGFELQFGTNYLSHFVLTAELLPLLSAGHARVITLSSIAARTGRIEFNDLQRNSYRPMEAYGQSKLACLLFAQELQRRSDAGGWRITSVAAHPGISRTNLIENGMGRTSLGSRAAKLISVMFQSAEKGALPTLYAATAPDVVPGGYYGPDGPAEIRGAPCEASLPKPARGPDIAARLWTVSQQLAAEPFPAVRAAA